MGRYVKVGKGVFIVCRCIGKVCKRPHQQPLRLAVLARVDGEPEAQLKQVYGGGGDGVDPRAVKLRKIPERESTTRDGSVKVTLDADAPGHFVRVHPSITCPCCKQNVRKKTMQDLTKAHELLVQHDQFVVDLSTLGHILEEITRR